VRNDDVPRLKITDHEAFLSFSQVQGHTQANACVQAILIRLLRPWFLSERVHPPHNRAESALPELC
jgi:hypothetical protein